MYVYHLLFTEMQREEKQLDSALTAIISRVNDLKSAIAAMIHKLETEYETINWPSFLDNYALLSGHVPTDLSILNCVLCVIFDVYFIWMIVFS